MSLTKQDFLLMPLNFAVLNFARSEKIFFNTDVFRRVLSQLITRSKGTLILRRKGRFYKVMHTRHAKDNRWMFKCKDMDKKKDVTFNFQIPRMWEVLDKASTMKDPKDILLIDLDQQGKWMIWTQDELKQRLRHEEKEKKQRN